MLNRAFQQERPNESYREFVEVMDAPISTMGEIRGVFGVYSRELVGRKRVKEKRVHP